MPPQRRIASIQVKNYKAFERETRLDILPLTLIFGRNASGKSAITRLPMLVGAAMSNPGVQGLPLQTQDFVFGSSLLDLVFGRLPGSTFELIVELANNAYSHKHKMVIVIGPDQGIPHFSSSRPSQRVWNWNLRSIEASRDESMFELEWDRKQSYVLRFATTGEADSVREIQFDGILPSGLEDSILDELGKIPQQLPSGFRQHLVEGMPWSSYFVPPRIAHLGPFRNEFSRFHRVGDRLATDLGTRGQHAGEVLGVFHSLGQHDVIEKIKRWYEEYLYLEVDVQQVGIEDSELATIVRARPKGRSAWVNLADVGTGTTHVLPYVIQQAISIAATPDVQVPNLLVCEEPEAHLHPSAQAGLAELAIETALHARSSVIIETHSETLLLRVRRRIAEGKLSPGSVAMYWVDDEGGSTELRRLRVEEDGWVDGWPEGIFAEATAEARGISKANRERSSA